MGIQAAGEFLHKNYSINISLTVRSFCCAYNRWQNCITKYMAAWCGEGSPQIIVDLIDYFSTFSISNICSFQTYDPNTDYCKQVLPPSFTPAKGYKNNAFLSWIFAFQCPNIAYGIIDESERHKYDVVKVFDPRKNNLVPDPILRYIPLTE